MPRYKITVAYEGTDFHGWQKQEPLGRLVLRTAQGVLEDAVTRVVREPIVLTGASRTDAGVHAHGQVAAFTTTRDIPEKKLPRAITARCPADIQVREAEVVPEHFDPIAKRKRREADCAVAGVDIFDALITRLALELAVVGVREHEVRVSLLQREFCETGNHFFIFLYFFTRLCTCYRAPAARKRVTISAWPS